MPKRKSKKSRKTKKRTRKQTLQEKRIRIINQGIKKDLSSNKIILELRKKKLGFRRKDALALIRKQSRILGKPRKKRRVKRKPKEIKVIKITEKIPKGYYFIRKIVHLPSREEFFIKYDNTNSFNKQFNTILNRYRFKLDDLEIHEPQKIKYTPFVAPEFENILRSIE